jgi:hypothetical protein
MMQRLISALCGLILGTGLVLAQTAGDAQTRLQGSWTATKAERDGKAAEDVVRLEPGAKPAAIDFDHTEGTLKSKAWKGIYALDGDTLRICDNAPNLDASRPVAFEAKSGSGYVFVTFERAKP